MCSAGGLNCNTRFRLSPLSSITNMAAVVQWSCRYGSATSTVCAVHRHSRLRKLRDHQRYHPHFNAMSSYGHELVGIVPRVGRHRVGFDCCFQRLPLDGYLSRRLGRIDLCRRGSRGWDGLVSRARESRPAAAPSLDCCGGETGEYYAGGGSVSLPALGHVQSDRQRRRRNLDRAEYASRVRMERADRATVGDRCAGVR